MPTIIDGSGSATFETPLPATQGGTGNTAGVIQIQTLPTPTLAANALTIPALAFTLAFRSATLTSAAITTITGTPAALVVPSGATLGQVSAVQSDIYLLALNNAGAIEYAVSNASGGVDLSETGRISTTAISAGAISATVVYSTTARTAVAYRVIGLLRSTQTTAGSWSQALTLLQGVGGQALAAMSSLGYGQSWTDVTGSRAIGTTYYNLSGKPICVNVTTTNTTSANDFWNVTVGGVLLGRAGQAYTVGGLQLVNFTVPISSSYLLTHGQGGTAPTIWTELR